MLSFLLATTVSAAKPATSFIQPTTVLVPTEPSLSLYYEITPRRKAFLDTIAYTEGTDRVIDKKQTGYNIMFAHIPFYSYDTHPYKVICTHWICSSASGRYQILDKTFNSIQKNLKLSGYAPFRSFSPQYQDQMALYLMDKRGALKYVDSGKIDTALQLLSYEWASLPPSRYGQPIFSPYQTKRIYYLYLGLHQKRA